MKTFGHFFLLIIFISAFSCDNKDEEVTPTGPITRIQRDISGFNGVDIRDGLQAFVEIGNSDRVVVEANQNLHQYVVSRIENNRLILEVSENVTFPSSATLNIYVNAVVLNILWADGGSQIQINDTLAVNDLGIGLSGGSRLLGNINVTGTVTPTLSGGSILTLWGYGNNYELNSTGGSIAEGFGLWVEDFRCDVSGGGFVSIHVEDDLHVTASGGSIINYKGNGIIRSENLSGGSVINHLP